MVKRIEKIIVFGDSNCAGDELLQEDYPEEIEKVLAKYDPTFSPIGTMIKVKNGTINEANRAINDYILKANKNDQVLVRKKQFAHSFGAHLGSLADVEVINYAQGGNSNVGIYNSVVNCRVDITPNTLLLIGTTYIHRRTRMADNMPPPSLAKRDLPYHHLLEHATFLPGWAPLGRKEEHETYQMLNLEWGEDNYFLYMAFIAQLKAMRAELKDRPHYFLDSTGAHRHSFLRTELHKQHRELIAKELKDIFLPKSSLYEIAPHIKKKSAMFGHCNQLIHKMHAQDLFDKLTEDNIL
jgi:hypothetical protein